MEHPGPSDEEIRDRPREAPSSSDLSLEAQDERDLQRALAASLDSAGEIVEVLEAQRSAPSSPQAPTAVSSASSKDGLPPSDFFWVDVHWLRQWIVGEHLPREGVAAVASEEASSCGKGNSRAEPLVVEDGMPDESSSPSRAAHKEEAPRPGGGPVDDGYSDVGDHSLEPAGKAQDVSMRVVGDVFRIMEMTGDRDGVASRGSGTSPAVVPLEKGEAGVAGTGSGDCSTSEMAGREGISDTRGARQLPPLEGDAHPTEGRGDSPVPREPKGITSAAVEPCGTRITERNPHGDGGGDGCGVHPKSGGAEEDQERESETSRGHGYRKDPGVGCQGGGGKEAGMAKSTERGGSKVHMGCVPGAGKGVFADAMEHLPLLCDHGGVDPTSVSRWKLVTRRVYEGLLEEEGMGPPDHHLTANNYRCEQCVRNHIGRK